MIKYYAYGSNMDLAQITDRIGRCPQREPGTLRGYVLRFNKQAWKKPGQAFANIEESKGEAAPGILYDITEAELEIIDGYESVKFDHYERHSVLVETSAGEVVQAVAHVACEGRIQEGLLPTRKYLNRLLAGAELLPDDHVQWLQQQDVLDSSEGGDE